MHLAPEDLAFVRRALEFWCPSVPAYAFGSRVHGRNLKPTSDLDICLKGPQPIPYLELHRLKDVFALSDLSMRVDLVDWHGLSPEFQQAIDPDLTRL